MHQNSPRYIFTATAAVIVIVAAMVMTAKRQSKKKLNHDGFISIQKRAGAMPDF
jgi:hypothetical protein